MGKVIEFKAGPPEDTGRRVRASRRRRRAEQNEPSSTELLAEALTSLAEMKTELMVTFERVSRLRETTRAISGHLANRPVHVVRARRRPRQDVELIAGAL